MNLVEITAPSELLSGLNDVAGLKVVDASVGEAGGGEFSVGAYATEEAIAAVRARGAKVTVTLSADTRVAQLQREAEEARRTIAGEESA
jgi:hypothetical protein